MKLSSSELRVLEINPKYQMNDKLSREEFEVEPPILDGKVRWKESKRFEER